MEKVFIVVDMSEGMGPGTVLRVFAKNDDAISYGESLCAHGTIEEFGLYECEVY